MCPVSGHARDTPTLRPSASGCGAWFIPIPGTLSAPSAAFRRFAVCYLFPGRAGGGFLSAVVRAKNPTPRQPSVGLYKGGGLGSGRFSLLSPGLSYRGVHHHQGVYHVYTAVFKSGNRYGSPPCVGLKGLHAQSRGQGSQCAALRLLSVRCLSFMQRQHKMQTVRL
jgi:hypothetical protein